MKDLVIKLKMDRSQAKRAADDQVADHKRISDAARAAAAVERGENNKILTEAQVQNRAKLAMIRDANRERVKSAIEASKAEVDGFKAGTSASEGFAGSLKSVASSVVGLQLIGQAASAIADAMKTARDHADKLAGDFIRQRDALREIAAISGGQANNAMVLDVARFNAATGMNQGESKAFITEFANAGNQNIGPGKSLGAAEAEKFKLIAGQYAVAKGVDPGVIGNLAGSSLGFTNFQAKGQGANEALNGLNRAFKVLEAGQGDGAVLARQLQMVSASTVNEDGMKGIFKSPEEAAIAVSVGAEKHDAQAAELVKAAARGLYDVKGKPGETLKAAGITDKDGFFDRVDKLAAHVNKEGTQKGIRPADFLDGKFDDILTKEAILTFTNRGVDGGVIAQRRGVLAAAQDPDAAQKTIRDFQGDPEGAGPHRLAEARKQLVENQRAADRAAMITLRTEAEADFEGSGLEDSPAFSMLAGVTSIANKATFGVVPDAKDALIKGRMRSILDERRMKAGLAPVGLGGAEGVAPGMLGYGGSATGVGEDQAMIAALRELTETLKRNAEREQPKSAPIPPPLRGRPDVQTRNP